MVGGYQCGESDDSLAVIRQCYFDAKVVASLIPDAGPLKKRERQPLRLFNHPSLQLHAWRRHTYTHKEKSRRMSAGSRREKVPGVRGERLKVSGSVGGSDGALLAVNEG